MTDRSTGRSELRPSPPRNRLHQRQIVPDPASRQPYPPETSQSYDFDVYREIEFRRCSRSERECDAKFSCFNLDVGILIVK